MSTPGGPDRDPYGPPSPGDPRHGHPRTTEEPGYGAAPPAPAWPVAPPSWPAPGAYPAPPPGHGAGAPGYGPPAAVPPGWAAAPSPAPAPRGSSGLVAAGLFTTAAAVFLLALAVGSLVLLVGIGGAALGAGFEDYEDAAETGQAYGDNDYLDGLWDDCEAGDGYACDELSWSSEYGSDYEQFGLTCGERLDDDAYAPMTCEDVVG